MSEALVWSPQFEQVVLLYVTGMPVSTIAKKFKLRASHVEEILAHEKARDIIESARRKLREKIQEDIGADLDNISKLATQRLRETLEASIPPLHRAKINQDRVALQILEGRGFLNESPGRLGGIRISPEQLTKLVAAMEKAQLAGVSELLPVEVVHEVVEAEESSERLGVEDTSRRNGIDKESEGSGGEVSGSFEGSCEEVEAAVQDRLVLSSRRPVGV